MEKIIIIPVSNLLSNSLDTIIFQGTITILSSSKHINRYAILTKRELKYFKSQYNAWDGKGSCLNSIRIHQISKIHKDDISKSLHGKNGYKIIVEYAFVNNLKIDKKTSRRNTVESGRKRMLRWPGGIFRVISVPRTRMRSFRSA